MVEQPNLFAQIPRNDGIRQNFHRGDLRIEHDTHTHASVIKGEWEGEGGRDNRIGYIAIRSNARKV